MRSFAVAVAVVLVVLAGSASAATTYEVGSGAGKLASIGAVPWESLAAGDTVLIDWRATPYHEKWVICRNGTAAAPITVRGVPGPGGELPVIDGTGATTRSQLNYWNETRGIIKIGGANVPPDTLPSYIVVENLELRGARQTAMFTGRSGTQAPYDMNAAAIYIEKADHVTIRHCTIADSGNGLFIAPQTNDALVEANYIYGNGNPGSIYEHNSYTEADGITFQYNHYGPLCAGCDGNNLKDRSAGTVIRYNWIESGNRQLDLVDSAVYDTVPLYRDTWVYGNVLVEPAGAGNSQIVHYGGDSGTLAQYRMGTLHFFHNTVVSTRTDNTTVFRLSSPAETVVAENNLLYVSAAGSALAMLDSDGTVNLRANWTKPGWVPSHSTLTGSVNNIAGAVTGAAPGFVNEAAQDFHLAGGSGALDLGWVLTVPAEHAVTRQYQVHQSSVPRVDDGQPDIGAFALCGSGCGPAPDGGAAFVDGGPDFADGALAGDGGAARDAARAGDGGADGGSSGSSSGCGCQTTHRSGSPTLLILLGLALALRLNARSRPGPGSGG